MFKPIILAFLLLSIFSGCGFAPGNLQSNQSTDLEGRRIRRIAVLPPAVSAGRASAERAVRHGAGAAHFGEGSAGVSLARFVHASMVALPNWQVVSESEVREAVLTCRRGSEEARLKRVGEMVYADAVMMSRVQRLSRTGRRRVGRQKSGVGGVYPRPGRCPARRYHLDGALRRNPKIAQ